MSDSLISLGLKSSELQSYFETQEKIKHLTSIPSPSIKAMLIKQDTLSKMLEPSPAIKKFLEQSRRDHEWYKSVAHIGSAFGEHKELFKGMRNIRADMLHVGSAVQLHHTKGLEKVSDAFKKGSAALAQANLLSGSDHLKPFFTRSLFPSLDINKVEPLLKLTAAIRAFENIDNSSFNKLFDSASYPAVGLLYERVKRDTLKSWLSSPASEAFSKIKSSGNGSIIFEDIELSKDDLEHIRIQASKSNISTNYLAITQSLDPNALINYLFMLYQIIWNLYNPYYNGWVEQTKNLPSRQGIAIVKSDVNQMSQDGKSEFEGYKIVFKHNLHVFETPKQRGKQVGTIPFGAKVKIEKEIKDWSLVYFNDTQSEVIIKGWVLTRYLLRVR